MNFVIFSLEKAPAWVALIFGIFFGLVVGLVVGFAAQPYVMAELNKSLSSKNQELQNEIVQLKQQLSKFYQSNKNQEDKNVQPEVAKVAEEPAILPTARITLLSCSEAHNFSNSCQFRINQPHDLIVIYAYGTVLKAGQDVIGNADTVQATDYEVSTLKTEEGEISS